MDQVQRGHLIPLQRVAFLCSASCCDAAAKGAGAGGGGGAGAMAALQECAARCSLPVQAAQQVAHQAVQDFQARFQNCATRCQDAARESLPAGGAAPSQKETDRAQATLLSCLDRQCGDEFLGKAGKLRADIEGGLKQASAQSRR